MSSAKQTKENHSKSSVKPTFVFGRMNYIITLASLLVIAVGFFLMAGREGDIYDFRRTTLAPIVVIIGFAIGFVAIFWKEKSSAE